MHSGRKRLTTLGLGLVLVVVAGAMAWWLWPRSTDGARDPARSRQALAAENGFSAPEFEGSWFRQDAHGRVVLTEQGRMAVLASMQQAPKSPLEDLQSDDPAVRAQAEAALRRRYEEAVEGGVQGVGPDGAPILPHTKMIPVRPVPPAMFGDTLPTPAGDG